MLTESLIYDFLAKAKVDPQGTLLVHSSFKSLGPVEHGANTVLDAFSRYMAEGLLVFPTHTWHPDNNPDGCYDPEQEPSCVGILGELFRKRPKVKRSLHPTHSVAALGVDAEAYIAADALAETPCPREGTWGQLYNRNAQILFMGCELTKNTFIHGVEEWFEVPQRLSKEPREFKVKTTKGWQSRMVHTHDAPCDDISLHYVKLLPVFLERGAAQALSLGEAQCYLCNAREMAGITAEYLQQNIDFFIDMQL